MFDDPEIIKKLALMTNEEIDELPFGLISFDRAGVVLKYNANELAISGLSMPQVHGKSLFTGVAPSLNNEMVAGRFSDSLNTKSELDLIIKYTCVLRTRPVKAQLRLIYSPESPIRYILIDRSIGLNSAGVLNTR